MAYQLATHAPPAEDSSSVPSSPGGASQSPITPASDVLFWPPWTLKSHVCRLTHRHTHIHTQSNQNIINLLKFSK